MASRAKKTMTRKVILLGGGKRTQKAVRRNVAAARKDYRRLGGTGRKAGKGWFGK